MNIIEQREIDLVHRLAAAERQLEEKEREKKEREEERRAEKASAHGEEKENKAPKQEKEEKSQAIIKEPLPQPSRYEKGGNKLQ